MSMFPETAPSSGLAYGFNRAKIAWYRISDIFYSQSRCPENITVDDRSRPYARRIYENEVFPNKSMAAGQPTYVYEMTLAYYPEEKGPYNYDVEPTAFSSGITSSGLLDNPQSRWGGIMRKLDYTDFETQNIEMIEFWLMDPFIENPTHSGGKMYINLGDISEDILRDGRKSFENGLPTSSTVVDVDTTIWGRVPITQPVVNAFDNNEDARMYQDIGYDGLGSTHGLNDEQSFFADYLQRIANRFGTQSDAYKQAVVDPSSDDYRYFRSSYYDDGNVKINDRYKLFNNPEGNSPVDSDSEEDYITAGSSYPNVEDINRDKLGRIILSTFRRQRMCNWLMGKPLPVNGTSSVFQFVSLIRRLEKSVDSNLSGLCECSSISLRSLSFCALPHSTLCIPLGVNIQKNCFSQAIIPQVRSRTHRSIFQQ